MPRIVPDILVDEIAYLLRLCATHVDTFDLRLRLNMASDAIENAPRTEEEGQDWGRGHAAL